MMHTGMMRQMLVKIRRFEMDTEALDVGDTSQSAQADKAGSTFD